MKTKLIVVPMMLALIVALFGSNASAFAALSVTVDDDHVQCPNAQYTSIQAAINASQSGTTIKVCPGTYPEQLVVNKGNLTITSTKPLAAVVQAPATMTGLGDIVTIENVQSVKLSGLTITGPLPDSLFCSENTLAGVRIDQGGSATLVKNHITQIRSANPDLRGCQNGIAVRIGGDASVAGTYGTADLENNTIDSYQKGGVIVNAPGSSATLQNNQIIGDGVLTSIGQNGIQISRGATAQIGSRFKPNTVTGNEYNPGPVSSGIILYQSNAVTIQYNQVTSNDYGIISLDAAGLDVEHNDVSGSPGYGIDIDEDTVGTNGAKVANNKSNNNMVDGIYVSPLSTNNKLNSNTMSGNGVYDAEDVSTGSGTAGTANFWQRDHCVTDNHGGLLCTGSPPPPPTPAHHSTPATHKPQPVK